MSDTYSLSWIFWWFCYTLLTMNWKKTLSRCFLFCYLISGSIFSHVASMDMSISTEVEMVMSDCGMMMPASSSTNDMQHDCFEKCFGGYDEVFVSFRSVDEENVWASVRTDIYCCDSKEVIDGETFYVDDPPDERCLVYSKALPYFSHSDTTKIE